MSGQGQNQSIDDFIACVIGMGFSLEDAQQAVSLGKLNIEDAIEWILAGKPEPRSPPAATTLRLNPSQAEQGANPIGANPFSNPQPLNLSAAGPASSAASSTPGWDGETKEGGEDVVSRIHMSDEQRQIKLNFEEKQRDEARRKAKQEKAAQKKAHAAILKQIQEDRDTQRLRRGAAHTSPGAESASSGSASPRAKEPRTDSPVTPPQTEGPKKCLLQVRLPDGRAIRESFPADAVLREVWNFVSQKIKVDNDMVLMQPFPRQEYGEDHMVQTLTELGLTPSGSLVLKKREKPQAPPDSSGQASLEAGVSRMSTEPAAGSPGDDSTSPPTSPLVPPAPPALPPQPMHVWGQGQSMQQPEQGEGDEPMEEPAAEEGGPADDGLDQDDGSDSDGDGDQPGGAWGAGGGGQGGGAWGGGGAGGGWGGGGGGGWGGGGGGGGGWGGGGGGGGGWGGGGGMGAWGGGLGMGWGGAGGADMDMEGHQWGEGQRLVGEVLNAENMPHHSKPAKELAAEAANVRRAQPDPVPGPSAEEAAAPALAEIPTLVHLIVRQVSGRVCDTRQPITSFQGLPADVAMKILGYLIKERLLRPKTLHPFLSCCLRKMVLDCYPYTTNELLHALRRHTYLTYLSMRDCPLITDKGLAAIRSLKRLKYLNLGNCRQITDTCIPTLQEFRNLVTLVLENTVVTDAGITLYCQRAPPNLQHLTLNNTEVTQAIFVRLTVLTKLKSLNLESTRIQSLTGIEQLTTLEHLNVSGTKLDSESLTCLSLLPRLVALNISLTLNTEGTGLNGDLALQAIHSLPLQLLELPDRHTTTDIGVQSISRMPLQTLDLSYYIHVTDDATPFIGALTSLTRLRLSNTKITDKGMLHLTGLKHLRELYLNRTAVTDEGAVVVAEFPNLQELGLMSTGITNTFLTSGMLNRCRLLSKLNLSRNYISNRGVAQIKLRCLTLLNLDCTKVKEDVEVTLKQNCPVLKKVMLSNLQPMTDDDMDM